jgi:hypothetical protein
MVKRSLPAIRILTAALLCLGLLSCKGGPPAKPAEGTQVVHEKGDFSLTSPSDWKITSSTRGFSLVRKTPYGGGFPTLTIRRVTESEARVLNVSGQKSEREGGTFVYRYQRWRNTRGQGYRLEALYRTELGLLFVDASVWDPSPQLNRRFFEEQFWPILNSIQEGRTTQLEKLP